ncbi:MAG: HD-GYP domain-containing protein, partial [Butyrivibrio sp.]|nr:HD-GYP domain-containing protein [Butyrivibrio sp.]
EKKSRQNEELFLGIVKSLAAAIDAKDTYTNGHSVRVADYSAEIARRAGYDVSALQRIYITGLLHDVGKIGIPDAIINKNGKLDDEEYAIIKTHPEKGAAILSNIQDMPELSIGARWHHERFDGKGYPEGLMGEDIPEMARIIAIADAYDAMTSNRSYRRSLPQEVVRAEIEKGKGTQFDPIFAEIMLQMIDEDTNYNMRDKGL